MGGCLGGLVKFTSAASIETHRISRRSSIGQLSSITKGQYSSSPHEMEKEITNSHSHKTHPSIGCTTGTEELKVAEKNVDSCAFINKAVIAWHERRCAWIGDQSQKPHKISRDPVISWSTTYDDLLSTSEPFPQPIPLPVMPVVRRHRILFQCVYCGITICSVAFSGGYCIWNHFKGFGTKDPSQ